MITWPASVLARRSGLSPDGVHWPCPTMPQRPSDQVGMRRKESEAELGKYTFVFKTPATCDSESHHWGVIHTSLACYHVYISVVFPSRHLGFEHFLPWEHLDLIHHPLLPQRSLAKDVGSFLMKNSNASQRTIPLSKDWILNHASSCRHWYICVYTSCSKYTYYYIACYILFLSKTLLANVWYWPPSDF